MKRFWHRLFGHSPACWFAASGFSAARCVYRCGCGDMVEAKMARGSYTT